MIPRRLQILARRQLARIIFERTRHCWPISEVAATAPTGFPGWPGGKRFAVVLTHDVEQEGGLLRCGDLADREEERGLRSTFGFVPQRYRTPERLRRMLTDRAFEVVVHDLHHDGKLFRDWATFAERSRDINEVLYKWDTRGFSSGAMHHNLAWISQLNIDYSTSTYDVDPFEPQACGLGRIFPFWVQSPSGAGSGFVEMPYTLPQDFTLFILLREQSNVIWRKKLDWIAAKGGMALMKTHPDYMIFPNERTRIDGYAVELYTDLLDYIRARYGDEAWFAQPSDIARYWRSLRTATKDNSIACCATLCASCRQALEGGWLNQMCPLPRGPERASAPVVSPPHFA